MLHSELLKKNTSAEGEPFAVYGVEIDEMVIDTNSNIKEIGIRAKYDPDGTLDLDVFDALIAYVSQKTPAILEIPFENQVEANSTIIEAGATEYDISLLPPVIQDDMTPEEIDLAWEQYGERLCEFTEKWLSKSNYRQQIFPVSGYFGYMVSEVFGYQPTEITQDPYIKSNFVKTIPIERMDVIKDKIKLVVLSAFGGQDNFETFAQSTAMSVVSSINAMTEGAKGSN